jgi:hypothetical protein
MATQITVIFLAGKQERVSGPARILIPVSVSQPLAVKMIAEEINLEFPGYIVPIDKKESELFTIVPHLDANNEMETTVVIDEKNPYTVGDKVVLTKVDDHRIRIDIGGHEFSSFYSNMEKANRPYLYPLIAPCGVGVTRNWPIKEDVAGDTTDHIHHKSCWSAWGDLNGTDNWGDGKKNGHQVTKDIKTESNAVYGRITVKNMWLDKNDKDQIEEIRNIIIYNTKDVRIIDFSISLKAINGDVKFGDTKEGGFLAVRVATPMEGVKGGVIENSLGAISEKVTWGKRAQWCDYSGIVNGKKVGIAMIDHHENYMFPTYWHVRDYGLMAANPLGISEFLGKGHNGSITLNNGKELVFKYRLIIHDGDAQDAKIKEHYLNYYIPIETPVFK